MNDEALELANQALDRERDQRAYSDEDKYIALAALDLNGGNVYRTAKAIDIPARTLQNWKDARAERRAVFADSSQGREKRGDLAAKVESLAHTLIEAMPGKVGKATLSQCAVTFGIAVDKVRILRGQGLDPDPAAELCRLLNINRSQLPERLELNPGESIPQEYLNTQPPIETIPNPNNPNSYEPANDVQPSPLDFIPESHSPDCDLIPNVIPCSCGADDRNAQKLQDDDDQPVN